MTSPVPKKGDGLDMLASAFELAGDLWHGRKTLRDVAEDAAGADVDPNAITADGVDTTEISPAPEEVRRLRSIHSSPGSREPR